SARLLHARLNRHAYSNALSPECQRRGEIGLSLTLWAQTSNAMKTLLLIGRWHAITCDQETALRRTVALARPAKLLFLITAADQSGTKRHPLSAAVRTEIVRSLAESLSFPYEIYAATDVADPHRWVDHICSAISGGSGGLTRVGPAHTVVVSGTANVLGYFADAGYQTLRPQFDGAMPADVLGAIVSRAAWREVATPGAVAVYERHGLAEAIRAVFAEVLLTEDGELSTGRDFAVYAAGMEASMAVKITDLCPHVLPGLIVDKGCGTGTLLVHLSELFPTSQIVGMDLSRELLHLAESQHYPHHNVTIGQANLIHPHL